MLPVVLMLLATSCESLVHETLGAVTPVREMGQTSDYVASVASLINAARLSEGRAQLKWSAELADAAQGHAQDMASNGFVSHTGSDGSDVLTRLQRVGYSASFRGEIIVWVRGGPEEAMYWWWNSPLHRSTLLGASYDDYGVGVAAHPHYGNQHYYVVVFAAR